MIKVVLRNCDDDQTVFLGMFIPSEIESLVRTIKESDLYNAEEGEKENFHCTQFVIEKDQVIFEIVTMNGHG